MLHLPNVERKVCPATGCYLTYSLSSSQTHCRRHGAPLHSTQIPTTDHPALELLTRNTWPIRITSALIVMVFGYVLHLLAPYSSVWTPVYAVIAIFALYILSLKTLVWINIATNDRANLGLFAFFALWTICGLSLGTLTESFSEPSLWTWALVGLLVGTFGYRVTTTKH